MRSVHHQAQRLANPQAPEAAMAALHAARRFAEALDRDDFESAAGLLSAHCVYEARAGRFTGASAVVGSYREASDWVKCHLESVSYTSHVEAMDGAQAAVLFVDHIGHLGRSHTYRCRQILTIGPNGLIDKIQHMELPGEREALSGFLASVSLSLG